MTRPLRPIQALVVFLAVLGALAPTALAGQGTPTWAAAFPVMPDPAECQVAPRSIEFFQQFVGTPAAVIAQLASPTPYVEHRGEPAASVVVAAVTATIHEEVACFNGDAPLRRTALWTDDNIVRGIAGNARVGVVITPEELVNLAARPTPLPATEQATLHGISDVQLLPDGRVVALMELESCCYRVPGRQTYRVIFAERQDRWLIDEIILAEPVGTSGGTPAQ